MKSFGKCARGSCAGRTATRRPLAVALSFVLAGTSGFRCDDGSDRHRALRGGPTSSPTNASAFVDTAGLLAYATKRDVREVNTIHLGSGTVTTVCQVPTVGLLRYAIPVSRGQLLMTLEDAKHHRMSMYVVNLRQGSDGIDPVVQCDALGVPVLDPTEKRVAWIEQRNGETDAFLCIASVGAWDRVVRIKGPFRIDNSGPQWIDPSGSSFLIASKSGQILWIDAETQQGVCGGETPQVIPGKRRFLYISGSELREHDLTNDSDRLVTRIPYIHEYYRAMRISPDGTIVWIQLLWPMNDLRPTKHIPYLVAITVIDGSMRGVMSMGSNNGPWAVARE